MSKTALALLILMQIPVSSPATETRTAPALTGRPEPVAAKTSLAATVPGIAWQTRQAAPNNPGFDSRTYDDRWNRIIRRGVEMAPHTP